MEASPGCVAATWCADSRLVAWSCGDGHVRQWDSEKNRVLNPLLMTSARLVEYSRPAPVLLAVADARRAVVRIVSASSGESRLVASPQTGRAEMLVIAITPPFLPRPGASRGDSAGASASPGGGARLQGTYAVAGRSRVTVLRYSGELVSMCDGSGNIVCAAFPRSDGPNPQRMATGEMTGVCRVWNVSTGTASCLLVLRGHSGWVTCLSFSADEGRRLATASFDGSTRVWDATARRPTSLLSIAPADDAGKRKLHALSFSGDSRSHHALAAAGSDTLVRVWSAAPGKGPSEAADPPVVFSGHSSTVFAVAYAPDGSRVVSGSADGYVRMWTVPAPPVVLSVPANATVPSVPETLGPSRRASRMLIYCPEAARSLKCDICANPFDAGSRAPFVGGCGHTYACKVCNGKLWEHAGEGGLPRCPVCRSELAEVAPNFELIRVLLPMGSDTVGRCGGEAPVPAAPSPGTLHARSLAARAGVDPTATPSAGVADDCYIALERLSWVEAVEAEVSSSAYTKTLTGHLDYEAASIKLAKRFGPDNAQVAVEARRRIENNVARLSRLRGPHVLQLYGASRARDPDGRILIVSEQMPGGSLAENFRQLRSAHCSVGTDAVLGIACQLCRAVLHLHRSGVARPSLEPRSVMLSQPLSEWSPSGRIKLADFGGSITRAGASTSRSLALMTSGAAPYLPPEALDPESTATESDSSAFERACAMDMYSLGVLMFELASGTEPWEGMRGAQIVAAVVGRQDRPGFVPAHLPDEVRHLMTALWAQSPADRPTAEQAVVALDVVPSAPPPPPPS
jgi:serine/threonine protein kinase